MFISDSINDALLNQRGSPGYPVRHPDHCPSMYHSIRPPQSVCLSVCLSTCPPVHLPVCPPICLSTCQSICPSIHPSTHPSIRPPVHPPIQAPVHYCYHQVVVLQILTMLKDRRQKSFTKRVLEHTNQNRPERDLQKFKARARYPIRPCQSLVMTIKYWWKSKVGISQPQKVARSRKPTRALRTKIWRLHAQDMRQ